MMHPLLINKEDMEWEISHKPDYIVPSDFPYKEVQLGMIT